MKFSTDQKRNLIEWNCRELSLSTQCELLSISKGALYYEPVMMDPFSIAVMSFIDRQHIQTPFFGSRKMVVELRKSGYIANRKRVQRLMRKMGISAIYTHRKLVFGFQNPISPEI